MANNLLFEMRRVKRHSRTEYRANFNGSPMTFVLERRRIPRRFGLLTQASPPNIRAERLFLRSVRHGPIVAGFEIVNEGHRVAWIPNSLLNRSKWSLTFVAEADWSLVALQKSGVGWLASVIIGFIPFMEGFKGSSLGREFTLNLQTPAGIEEGRFTIDSDSEALLQMPDVLSVPIPMFRMLVTMFAILLWEQQ
jgi:hypothetical protein